eukprot:4864160-Amphidinium_carterae.1
MFPQDGPPVEQQTTLASMPVSIKLVDEEGNTISIADLTDPIEVTLVVENRTEDMVCGWFDEETQEWRTDGVELIDGGDAFICASTHLTVFGAVIKGAFGALLCSNADLMTSKGLSKLGKGDWWYRPGAVLFWLLVSLEVGAMFYIGCRSQAQRTERGWDDEHLLTASTAFDNKSGMEAKKALQKSQTLQSSRLERNGTVGTTVTEKPPVMTVEGVTHRITTFVARLAIAGQQHVHQQDLAALLKGGVNYERLKQAKSQVAWGAPAKESRPTNLTRQPNSPGQLQKASTNLSH